MMDVVTISAPLWVVVLICGGAVCVMGAMTVLGISIIVEGLYLGRKAEGVCHVLGLAAPTTALSRIHANIMEIA